MEGLKEKLSGLVYLGADTVEDTQRLKSGDLSLRCMKHSFVASSNWLLKIF